MKNLFTILFFGLLNSCLIAQIGIGTNSPHSSAALDLSAQDKALLLPRIALTGINDNTTIPNPVAGLMVYNTQNAGSGNQQVYEDLIYVHNGSFWNALMDDNEAVETINMPVLYAKGRKNSTNTTCTGMNSAPFSLEVLEGSINAAGSITADKKGFYKFTVRIIQLFGLEYIPIVYTPAGIFSYNFKGNTGYVDREVSNSGIVFLEENESTPAFTWNLGGNNTCNANHRIKQQEIIWLYLGDTM